MSVQGIAQKCGVTSGKLILIGALMVIFIAVVYWNFLREASGGEPVASEGQAGSASSAAAEEDEPPKGAASPAAGSQRASQTGTGDVPPRKPWPHFGLAETIARDPFALPTRFPQPAGTPGAGTANAPRTGSAAGEGVDEQRTAVLAALQQQRVQVIMRNGNEYVAKIGDREVKVGDRIGGFRVVDISIHGVELEGEASP